MKERIKIIRIPGVGIGPECVKAASRIMEAAVKKAYNGAVGLNWIDADLDATKDWQDQLKHIIGLLGMYRIALKGPTEKPAGMKSLNVLLRVMAKLYACIRPISWVEGVPSPLKNPEDYNFVIFRENTEDCYVSIECGPNTENLRFMQKFLVEKWKQAKEIVAHTMDMAIGITIVTKEATQNITRAAIQYAIDNDRSKVTIGAKDNIMELTNGWFKKWAIELIVNEFGAKKINKWGDYEIVTKDGRKIIINHRITDNLLQQMIMRPQDYDVVILMNFTGDVFTDGLAGLVGGIGMACGVNKNNKIAVYEATHGTWPEAAGQNRANPSAITRSGAMLLRDENYPEAANLIEFAIESCILKGLVTEDLGKQMELPEEKWLSTTQFTDEVTKRIETLV